MHITVEMFAKSIANVKINADQFKCIMSIDDILHSPAW